MIDNLLVTLIVLAGFALCGWGLERLRQQDRQILLDNKCPPHKWDWFTDPKGDEREDTVTRGYFRCSKCERKAGELNGPRNTWPMFPAV